MQHMKDFCEFRYILDASPALHSYVIIINGAFDAWFPHVRRLSKDAKYSLMESTFYCAPIDSSKIPARFEIRHGKFYHLLKSPRVI